MSGGSRNLGATVKSSPQNLHILPAFLLAPNNSIFLENSGDVLTDFLDFFLTKENHERDVKEC